MRRLCAFIVFGLMFAAVSVAQVPASNHVVLVVEENHSYSSVIGNSAMPYLNSLASKYGLATQYYANTHPSIGNYFEMTTGQILTNNDSQTPATFPVAADNVIRQLMVAGKTWKSYAEGLPSVGYTGGDTGLYAVRHNPFAYFTDVQNSSAQKLNLVPFSQFSTDLANNSLPNFSYVVPNLNNDAHNGTLQQADAWLQQNIAPLLANAAFQQDGILIITFDESVDTDAAHGGGQIATLVIGPKAKAGYKSTTLYQHQSLLRTVLSALGASSYPGSSASAPAMSDFFVSQTTPQATTGGVTISAPSSGATVTSPVRFVASATSGSTSYPITAMRLYVDNQSKYTVSAASLDTSLSLAAGTHYVVVVAWDSSGKSYRKSENITVSATTAAGVTISSPANGATVGSPVTFKASATAPSGRTITAMQIYDNNTLAYSASAASLNTALALAAGAHYIVIQAWDNTGAVYKASENITVSAPVTTGTLSISPSSLSFGSVNVGSSASKSVTVTANTAAVTISQATVSGSGFSVSGLALPMALGAGQSAAFQVKFLPAVSGSVNGSLSLTSNASNTPSLVSLSGTGASVSSSATYSIWSASATPAQLDSGDSGALELGVKFKTDVAGYVTGIRYYKSSNNTGSHIGNLWTSTGTRLATATFTNETASGWQQVNFATPVAVSAGTVYVASYYAPAGHYADNQSYFTAGIDNPPLHALANGGVYKYGSASGFPNQTWNASNYWVDVVFTATGTVPVTGTLSVSPASLGFGSVNVGSSASQTVTLSASTAAVTVSQTNISGTGFSVSGLTLPATIPAGQSLSFSVEFTPTAAGTMSGSLALISNASNGNATIALGGTGVTVNTQPHSVKLNWIASTSSNIVGYNVYRGTQSGGPYTKITSSSVSGTSYTDSNVSSGTTYYYAVTAVDSTGAESSYSNSATAAIP